MVSHTGIKHTTPQGRSERLHTRIVRVLILLTTAPLVLGAVISLAVTIINSRTQVTHAQQQMAMSVGNLVYHQWEHTLSGLRSAATSIAQSPSDRVKASVLTSLEQECAACQTIWLVDTAGSLLQQVGQTAPLPSLDKFQRTALADGSEVLPSIPASISSTSVVTLLVPVRRVAAPAGALLINLDLQMLGGETLTLLHFDHDGYSYIADRSGRLLISPDLDRTGSRIDLRTIPLVDAAINNVAWQPPQSQAYTGLLAPRVDGVWYHISQLDWYVFVEAPQAALSANNWTLFGIQGLLLVLTSSIAVLLGRRYESDSDVAGAALELSIRWLGCMWYCCATRSVTVPCSVNFVAFVSRFSNIWRSRNGSLII